jgi:hypothetical protein
VLKPVHVPRYDRFFFSTEWEEKDKEGKHLISDLPLENFISSPAPIFEFGKKWRDLCLNPGKSVKRALRHRAGANEYKWEVRSHLDSSEAEAVGCFEREPRTIEWSEAEAVGWFERERRTRERSEAEVVGWCERERRTRERSEEEAVGWFEQERRTIGRSEAEAVGWFERDGITSERSEAEVYCRITIPGCRR